MSFRWSLEEDDGGQDTAELAIRAAAMNGIVVVVSAGNCGFQDPDALANNNCALRHQRQRPAVYPGVIAVAATDEANLRADYSTSNRDVDIAAPGDGILSTWPEADMLREVSDGFTLAEDHRCGRSADSVGKTCWKSGTSMAAPVVSGVVAHMKAHYPGASVTQIQYALYSTADRTNDSGNPNYSKDYGHGFVDPSGAIEALGDIKRRRGDFEALSAGAGHTCGLATNGAVECWGHNADGQADRAAGTFTAVSSGGFHTCGIREADRAVECWGRDDHKQTSTAPPAVVIVGGEVIGSYVTAVASGGYHSCAILEDDTVECWGRDDHGQASPPAGAFATISAGWLYTCGLEKTAGDQQTRPGGSIKCWGQRDKHRIPSGPFVTVSAGRHHACGLRDTGTVECWGIKDGFDNSLDDHGQADPPNNLKFSTVSAGGSHTCGISGGIVDCWGRDDDDQANTPAGRFIAVSSGQFHSCGIRPEEEATYTDHDGISYQVLSSGTIHCWGQNTLNQTEAPAPGQSTTDTATTSENVTYSDGRGWGQLLVWSQDRWNCRVLGPE